MPTQITRPKQVSKLKVRLIMFSLTLALIAVVSLLSSSWYYTLLILTIHTFTMLQFKVSHFNLKKCIPFTFLLIISAVSVQVAVNNLFLTIVCCVAISFINEVITRAMRRRESVVIKQHSELRQLKADLEKTMTSAVLAPKAFSLNECHNEAELRYECMRRKISLERTNRAVDYFINRMSHRDVAGKYYISEDSSMIDKNRLKKELA